MSKITGTLMIDFETNNEVTKEQFEKFKEELDENARLFSFLMADSAKECGVITDDDTHSIVLMNLDLDKPEEF